MLAVSDWSPVSGLTLFFLHFRSKKEAIATKPDSAAKEIASGTPAIKHSYA
jgi:hypothetical protein